MGPIDCLDHTVVCWHSTAGAPCAVSSGWWAGAPIPASPIFITMCHNALLLHAGRKPAPCQPVHCTVGTLSPITATTIPHLSAHSAMYRYREPSHSPPLLSAFIQCQPQAGNSFRFGFHRFSCISILHYAYPFPLNIFLHFRTD